MLSSKTFKQRVAEDPKAYLTPKEDIFINKKFYDWGETSIYKVEWENVYEFYDLINEKFYYKIAAPFENAVSGYNMSSGMIFKGVETDKDYDISDMVSKLKEHDDAFIMFRVSYPNKYFIQNTLVMLIEKKEWYDMNDIQREYYITINAYINLVLRKCIHRSWKEIENAPGLDDQTMNWVWFRKSGFKVPKAMMDKVLSWVNLNPEMSFVLWTDLEDEEEFNEFISDVADIWSPKIQVKYLKDTLTFVKEYLECYKDKEAIKNFKKEEFLELIERRVYGRTMIAKTDFLRAMILHHNGGFYADFNDCQCFVPIRYWFKELVKKQGYILPCDTLNEMHISNYFMYVPKGSKAFRTLHFDTLGGFEGILKCFRDKSTPKKIAELYIPVAKKFWKRLVASGTYTPTQLMVDIMFPLYENGKYLTGLREALTENAVKGMTRCDIRPKCFFVLFIFKYLAKKYDNKVLMEFYDYMTEEFKQIGNIRVKRAPIQMNNNGQIKQRDREVNNSGSRFEVVYMSQSHVEDWDDCDVMAKIGDDVLEKIEALEDDKEFHGFIHDHFVRNMVQIPMHMTNIILQLQNPLSFKELVPLCFIYLNMTHMTLVGHYGDGTSIGIE